MEMLVSKKLFDGIYQNKRVIITGNTGFKGSWLSLWLKLLGANVIGISLKENFRKSHFELLKLNIETHFVDILDFKNLDQIIKSFKPDIVFHLAAQPIVKLAMEDPVSTFQTNLIGTLNLFESCKKNSIKNIINVTSDKVYKNNESKNYFRESDEIGGNDLYSASKACVEIMTDSYNKVFDSYNIKISNLRSGNVIGGGDWGQNRLIPDIVKSYISSNDLIIRNPNSIRPWQHVLSIISGYLIVGQKLLLNDINQNFNFGPLQNEVFSVQDLYNFFQIKWGDKLSIKSFGGNFYESKYLFLDSTKARKTLNWNSIWDFEESVNMTIDWYDSYVNKNEIISYKQLICFIEAAQNKNIKWAQE